ncbi:MAG: aminopeptidase P family protein [Bacilli bacterium]|nr:aminopeptidase P family protein [Bacilli bacterium]
MKTDIINNLNNLRKLMKENKIDAYIVPTNDFHGSEYVGDYFKVRSFISGFTGSAGTVVVTLDEAGLWTDGRYFLQAEDELDGTTIDLYKSLEPSVPTIFEFLDKKLDKDCTIGFDGKLVSIDFVEQLKASLSSKNINIFYQHDLIDQIWDNRPSISKEKAFELSLEYTGISRVDKFNKIKEHLVSLKADLLLLTSLDDIAWLFNLRGNDVACNPVLLSYAVVGKDYIKLYVNDGVLDKELIKKLNNDGVIVLPYNDIYNDVKLFNNDVVVYQKNKVNYALVSLINAKKVINEVNYTTILKAEKNDIEVKNAYTAHLKDGVAVTKFIYWLKSNVGKIYIDEITASEKLEEFRKEQESFMGISFETICGYKEHGAIIHYSATPLSKIEVLPKSFLLVDSGGQYLEGTTDITRTISLGELNDKEKLYYTLVLKGHLDLSNAIFRNGTTGAQLDILARKHLYAHGLNYNHGTGHGVGSFLNVHEGPQNISPTPRASYPFKEGMITSNEPGIYLPGEFGIRIENLVVCKKYIENDFGKFLCFDDLTLVPYDIEAIDKTILSDEDIANIHAYHERVFEALKDYLTIDEKNWLYNIKEAI